MTQCLDGLGINSGLGLTVGILEYLTAGTASIVLVVTGLGAGSSLGFGLGHGVTQSIDGLAVVVSADGTGSGDRAGFGAGGINLIIGPAFGGGTSGLVLGLAASASVMVLGILGLHVVGRSNHNKLTLDLDGTGGAENLYGHISISNGLFDRNGYGVFAALGRLSDGEFQIQNGAIDRKLNGLTVGIHGNQCDLDGGDTFGDDGIAVLKEELAIALGHVGEGHCIGRIGNGKNRTDHAGVILDLNRKGNNVFADALHNANLQIGLSGNDQILQGGGLGGGFILKEGAANGTSPVCLIAVGGSGGSDFFHKLGLMTGCGQGLVLHGGLGLAFSVLKDLTAGGAGVVGVVTAFGTGSFLSGGLGHFMVRQRQRLVIGIAADGAGSGDGTGLGAGGVNLIIGISFALGAKGLVLGLAAGASVIMLGFLGLGVFGRGNQYEVTLHLHGGGGVDDLQRYVCIVHKLDVDDLHRVVGGLRGIQNLELQVGDNAVLGDLHGGAFVVEDQSHFILAGNDQSFEIALFNADQLQSGGIVEYLELTAGHAGVVVQDHRNGNGFAVLTGGILGRKPGGEGAGDGGIGGKDGIGGQAVVIPVGTGEQVLGEADGLTGCIGVKVDVDIGGGFLLVGCGEGDLHGQTFGTEVDSIVGNHPSLGNICFVQLIEFGTVHNISGGYSIGFGIHAGDLGRIGCQIRDHRKRTHRLFAGGYDTADYRHALNALIVDDHHVVHGQRNRLFVYTGNDSGRNRAGKRVIGDQQVLNIVSCAGHFAAEQGIAPLGGGAGIDIINHLHPVNDKGTVVGTDHAAVVPLLITIAVDGIAFEDNVLHGYLLASADLTDNGTKAVGAVILGKGGVGEGKVFQSKIVAGKEVP